MKNGEPEASQNIHQANDGTQKGSKSKVKEPQCSQRSQ